MHYETIFWNLRTKYHKSLVAINQSKYCYYKMKKKCEKIYFPSWYNPMENTQCFNIAFIPNHFNFNLVMKYKNTNSKLRGILFLKKQQDKIS